MFDKEKPIQASPFVFKPAGSGNVVRQVPRFDLTKARPKIDIAGVREATEGAVKSPRSDDDDVFLTPATSKIQEKMSLDKLFDPYQVFEVEHRPCLILQVRVLCGRNITKGWADVWDTPDPYLILVIRTAPEGRKTTAVKDNEINPVWNESFTFLLDETLENIMEIRLMEANYMVDEIVGTTTFNIDELPRNKWEKKTFVFNDVSEIDMEMMIALDQNPTLRYSLCLCDEEKEFLLKRRVKVMEGMKNLLGQRAPQTLEEVPTIGVIGSGGGFRAMVGLSGVVKALHDSGVLQCTTYVCGLSGSSWYISTLYSHEDFPDRPPGDMQEELMNNIDSSLLWLLTPQSVYRYMDRIMKKRQNGQPVSFTDFFGHMVGETLLKGRLEAKLSDQQLKIADGSIPMPILTCVHVKKDRSARSFQEWVEFSPYEIGMAKYGTFMKTELFGCKFFMGQLCKRFEEPPLHFLQGIWGSAFCILFKRILDDNRRLDPVEMIRQEMAKQIEETEKDESSDSSDDGEFDDSDTTAVDPMSTSSTTTTTTTENQPTGGVKHAFSFSREAQARVGMRPSQKPLLAQRTVQEPVNGQQRTPPTPKRMVSTRRTKQKGYWHNFLKGVFENKNFELLSTRAGRAGVIHNFMRGLSLQQTYPLSPFSSGDSNDEFDGVFEMHPTNVKHLYMVDAGLTFNSPYPVMLRPQREVDIILSFDFSARPSDTTPPFKELLLAEQWAKKFKLPFPPIDTTVFDREGLKELYIFRHPSDPYCPIVLHFCLVNIDFRKYVSPGVRRRTEEEKDFANFDIFDDPTTPYSTFNFKYSHLAFERLAKLTEFNTLMNVNQIKNVISEIVEKKRKTPAKCPCTIEDIPRLRRVSQKNRNRLSRFVSRIRSGQFRPAEARKNIDNSVERQSIVEEQSLDVADAAIKLEKSTLTRQTAVNKKSPRPVKRVPENGNESVSVNGNHNETNQTLQQTREIPGRRKPPQPESGRQWHDQRCNSIDDDEDDRFYTATSS